MLLDLLSNCSLSRALQIALFVIKVAGITFILLFFISFLEITDPFLGFGKSVSWKEDGAFIPPGHTMTYGDALNITINDFIIKVVAPDWAMGLIPRLRRVKLGFEELHVCRQEYPTLITFSEVIRV